MTSLTVRALRCTPVEVPMNHVLGTSRAAIRAAPLMLIDLETEEGITGRAYLFCYIRAAAVGIAGILEEVERLATQIAQPADGPRLFIIKVLAENPPRSLPSRDAVFIKNRFRAHLGFAAA